MDDNEKSFNVKGQPYLEASAAADGAPINAENILAVEPHENTLEACSLPKACAATTGSKGHSDAVPAVKHMELMMAIMENRPKQPQAMKLTAASN
mmetsp:Transcript_151240/g.266940  ORF Transcript_151240/g.266940 Transcript_151240/m.266940 type:complete len:95 (+) Transcript_151240:190-474(+)